ncbi:MAG: hypothetical protein WCK78_04110 [Paludibacter sp.]
MSRPNRKDLRRLNSIQSMTENLQSAYSGLSSETQTFLREEFKGETELKLRDFGRNVSETIEELKKPVERRRNVRN